MPVDSTPGRDIIQRSRVAADYVHALPGAQGFDSILCANDGQGAHQITRIQLDNIFAV